MKQKIAKVTYKDDEGKRRQRYLIKEGDEVIAVIRTEREAKDFVASVKEQRGH